MKITRVNLFLGVLMLGILVLAVFVGRDMSRPNYEFLPDMKRSPAYGTYSTNPNFSNGRTLQTPVEGTIARGELPLHYGVTAKEAKRAGEDLDNPMSGDKQDLLLSVKRGSEVYRVSCAVCHAASGLSADIEKLPLVQRSIFRPKPVATGDSVKMKDGQLFHILTFGQRAMEPFAGQLTPRQRWDAVNYVRDLQQRHARQTAAKQSTASKKKPAEKKQVRP